MKLYSTNLQAAEVSFETALIEGQAPDKGLYLPRSLPLFSGDDLMSLKDRSYPEVAFHVLRKVLEGEIDEPSLKEITYDAYNYDVPLELSLIHI